MRSHIRNLADVGTAPAPAGTTRGVLAPGKGEFVGRESELEQLTAAVQAMISGCATVVVLAGDAGIGKTRTAEELAAAARACGAAVHWGRCHEGGGAPAYWPWVQVLRSLFAGRTLRRGQPGAGAVAQLVPELKARTGAARRPGIDPEQARFELFDGVTSSLRAAADLQPLVVVLDDLHWADASSLLLLQFLARQMNEAPLLVVLTYREVELEAGHPLSPVLADLRRARGFLRLHLRGLRSEAVRDLASGLCGREVSPSFADALARRTEGNPFFVEELMRHCAEEGLAVTDNGRSLEGSSVPEGVNAIIRRRLRRLDAACNRVLTVAAAIGRDFDAAILRRVLADAERDANVEAALQQAERARIVAAVRGRGDVYRFSHALVRETLYEGQQREQRGRLHARIGEVLEESFGSDARPPHAELAHHFVEASRAGGDPRAAVHHSILAARQAGEALAYEEAVSHYERALDGIDSGHPAVAADDRRAAVLLALGEELMHAGEPARAKEVFLQAAAAARAIGSAEHLARAALGYETIASDLGGTEPGRHYVRLLEEAAEALGAGESRERALVLARLAQVPHRSMPRERRAAMSEEAVTIARQLDDPYTLAVALRGRNYALWDAEPPQARLERAEEVLRFAEQAGDRGIALDGRLQRAFAYLELGRRTDLEREVHAYRALADELRQPRYLWLGLIMRTTLATLAGDFAEAESLGAECLTIGQRHNQSNAVQVYALQMLALRRETGGLDEVEPTLRLLSTQHPIAAWHCALALLYSELGREEEARQEYERLAANGFADVPVDPLWLISIAALAEVCAFLDDADRAAGLYGLLAPYAHQAVVVGGAVSLGSASRPLGMLARTMDRLDDAVAHLEEAVRFDGNMGAAGALARSQHELAIALRRRQREGDAERAAGLEATVQGAVQRLGLHRIHERLGPSRASSRASGGATPAANAFRREGEYWTLAYADRVVRLRDAKGLHYLALLLGHPRRQFHVADLVASARVSRLADTGPVVDDTARSAYRRRLEELREELAEAERFNDLGRMPALREEIDGITDHLHSALDPGGRARRSGSYSERARLTVTQCIKASLRKIQSAHPALGHHLARSVRTGYFCAYDPGPGGPADWAF